MCCLTLKMALIYMFLNALTYKGFVKQHFLGVDQHLALLNTFNAYPKHTDEGLRESRQFWNARRWKLSDMIKTIGPQGLVFFTFSAADLYWPDLHKLMPSECNH